MNRLSVIIPFLNEGKEVYNTVKNLRETAGDSVDIILTDDASTDGYDYRAVAGEFGARFIVHDRRKGVAASRDEAVELSETEYFILLDGHMRFYQNDWVEILLGHLDSEPRSMFCCQSIVLRMEDNGEVVRKERPTRPYGASIDFSENGTLEVKWNNLPLAVEDDGADVVDIPCILGAGYACSKKYWTYLGGLEGLRSYGCDEAFISMKVWLEGGRCRLLRNLPAGHLYRKQMPYTVESVDRVFNVFYLAELFLGYRLRESIFRSMYLRSPSMAGKVFAEMDMVREHIEERKRYYASIFTRKLDFVVDMNKRGVLDTRYQYLSRLKPGMGKEELGALLCGFLVAESERNERPGLLRGKAGMALVTGLYGKRTGIKEFSEVAEKIIDAIFETISTASPPGFSDGLMGIALAVDYMASRGAMEVDTGELFEEIDRRVLSAFEGGVGHYLYEDPIFGVGLYFLMRKDRSAAVSESAFVGKLMSLCEMTLKRMTESGERFETPYNPLMMNSVAAFLAGTASEYVVPESLTGALADCLVHYAPSIARTMDGYVLKTLLDRIPVRGVAKLLPEISADANDAAKDIAKRGERGGKELPALCARCGLNEVLFDVRLEDPLREAVRQSVVDTMTDSDKWRQAMFFLDGDNTGLEGVAGLALTLIL